MLEETHHDDKCVAAEETTVQISKEPNCQSADCSRDVALSRELEAREVVGRPPHTRQQNQEYHLFAVPGRVITQTEEEGVARHSKECYFLRI